MAENKPKTEDEQEQEQQPESAALTPEMARAANMAAQAGAVVVPLAYAPVPVLTDKDIKTTVADNGTVTAHVGGEVPEAPKSKGEGK